MRNNHALATIACAALLLALGCNRQQPSEATSAISAKPQVSINAVMVALVDHAGHVLWDAEHEGKAPKTAEDWQNIEEHAVQLVAAGPAISAGGTGPSDAVWVKSPEWQKYAQALSDAGSQALSAAKAQNMEALVAANGKLVESCENCHKQFKPTLPTEGITHAHAHGGA